MLYSWLWNSDTPAPSEVQSVNTLFIWFCLLNWFLTTLTFNSVPSLYMFVDSSQETLKVSALWRSQVVQFLYICT